MDPSRDSLVAEIRRLRAQARRDTDWLNELEAANRVLKRALVRQVRRNDAAEVEIERLRHRLAVFEPED